MHNTNIIVFPAHDNIIADEFNCYKECVCVCRLQLVFTWNPRRNIVGEWMRSVKWAIIVGFAYIGDGWKVVRAPLNRESWLNCRKENAGCELHTRSTRNWGAYATAGGRNYRCKRYAREVLGWNVWGKNLLLPGKILRWLMWWVRYILLWLSHIKIPLKSTAIPMIYWQSFHYSLICFIRNTPLL